MRKVWRWRTWVSCLIAGAFLIVDVSYFGANLLKIADGGWLPLSVGAVIFFLMLTWRSGVDAVRQSLANNSESADRLVTDLAAGKVPRVPGTAIFLTRSYQQIPPLLIDHVRHMGALHEAVIALTVLFEEDPRIEDEHRCSVEPLAAGIWRVTIRFGFIEIPDLTAALKRVPDLDRSIDLDHAIYFATRDLVAPKPGSSVLARWRLLVFAFLYRNAVKVVDRFSLPADRVVEIARQIEL